MDLELPYEPTVDELVYSYLKLRLKESNPTDYEKVGESLDYFFGNGYEEESHINDGLKLTYSTEISSFDQLQLANLLSSGTLDVECINTWPSAVAKVYSNICANSDLSWKSIVFILELSVHALSKALDPYEIEQATDFIESLVKMMRQNDESNDGTFEDWIQKTDAYCLLLTTATEKRPPSGVIPKPSVPPVETIPFANTGAPTSSLAAMYALHSLMATDPSYLPPDLPPPRSATGKHTPSPPPQVRPPRTIPSTEPERLLSSCQEAAIKHPQSKKTSSSQSSTRHSSTKSASNPPSVSTSRKCSSCSEVIEYASRQRIFQCNVVRCKKWMCVFCTFIAETPAVVLEHLRISHANTINPDECDNCGTPTPETVADWVTCQGCGWCKCLQPGCTFQTSRFQPALAHLRIAHNISGTI